MKSSGKTEKSMTLALLRKECKLTASPLSYIFLAFSVMTLIPGYPILVGAFFICFGLFQSYQSARENNDILYTVLLPVRKAHGVKAKFLFALMIEGVGFLLMLVFTILRMTLMKDLTPYVRNAMMNANQAYLAYSLIIFGLFNLIFIRGFFKTAYRFGKPFVLFGIAAFLVIALGETLHHIPGLTFLNTTDGMGNGILWAMLLIGAAAYGGMTALAYRGAKTAFEQVDL